MARTITGPDPGRPDQRRPQPSASAPISSARWRPRTGSRFGRASKVGRRLDVEIDFVRDFDAVRAVLHERFVAAGQPVSLSVGFTADRKWAV